MRRFILLLLFTTAAVAQSKPDPAATASCSAVSSITLPAITPRNPADQQLLENCDALYLYYGVPKRDLSEARRCALYQQAHPPADWASDETPRWTTIAALVMIYVNGQGSPRNLDLALHSACLEQDNTLGDPTVEQLIAMLAARKSQPTTKPYDLCDDGPFFGKLAGLECQDIQMSLKQQARDARLSKFMSTWTPAQRAAWKQFNTVFKTYVGAVVDNETEACITGTASEQMDLTDQLRLRLFDDLTSFERGQLPAFTHADFLAADHTLNVTYSSIIASMNKETGDCAKPSSMIRDSERAWLGYRDAWLAFAKVRYPAVAADSWLTQITRQRTAWLKDNSFAYVQ